MIPSSVASGTNSGITMNEISRNSRLMPSTNTMMFAAMMKPQNPPGIAVSQLVITRLAAQAVEDEGKERGGGRDSCRTRPVMLVVDLAACMIRLHEKFP